MLKAHHSLHLFKNDAEMNSLFLRTSSNFSAICCFVLMSLVSQCKAQAQVLPASGNSEVTIADAEVIFGTGAREIEIDGMLDLDMSSFEDGKFALIGGIGSGGFLGVFPALAVNSSEVSIDLQNESGEVIGTLTSSTLMEINFAAFFNAGVVFEFEAAFVFENAIFTSTDGSTAGIVADSFTITTSDLDFPGDAGFFPTRGITPDDFFANVSNSSFTIDESDVEISFASDGTTFTEEVKILQSNPNQEFTFSMSTTLLGDVNLDERVDFSDIAPFIAILSSSGFQEEADINEDNLVSFSDISPFIAILSGN